MDPPVMIHHHYSLGDPAKPEHVACLKTVFDNQMAIASLKPNDACFLRAGDWFTFARVLSRKHGPEAEIELLVDEYGCTMTIPISLCVRHVRTMKSLSVAQHHAEDSPPSSGQPHVMTDGKSNDRPEAGARARLVRPQRTLSVPSLSGLVGRRRASLDEAAPVDVSQLNPSRSRPEGRASVTSQTELSLDEQPSFVRPAAAIESRQTRPHQKPPSKPIERRSSGVFPRRPVYGGRRRTIDCTAPPPLSSLHRPASAVPSAEDLLNLIAGMKTSSSKVEDVSGSDSDAEMRINVDSSSDGKSSTTSKPTNHCFKPIRSGRRASLDDRTASSHSHSSLKGSEAGARARLVRPQRIPSVPSLSNPVHGSRRATLDDCHASPVDVSQFDVSQLNPSSLESKIHDKFYCPTSRQSSHHQRSTTAESHSEGQASVPSHTEFVRAVRRSSLQTKPHQKPPSKHLERRSSGVLPRRPVCGGRRRSLAAAEDLLSLIASIRADSPEERCHVPILVATHDDGAPSDVSSSEVEDDNNSDNDAGKRVGANSSSVKKSPTASKQNIDLPGLDTVGLNDQFWNEAWYALD